MYKRVKLSDQPQGFIINEKGDRCLSTHEQMTRDFGRRVLQWWYMMGKRLGLLRDLIVLIGSFIPLDYQECPVWNEMQKYPICAFKTVEPLTNDDLVNRIANVYFSEEWSKHERYVELERGRGAVFRALQYFRKGKTYIFFSHDMPSSSKFYCQIKTMSQDFYQVHLITINI